jgi:hypothetical protein
MSTWELFQNAYQSASTEVKALIDSEKIPTFVEAALTKRNANRLQASATAQISYEILGVQTIDETVRNLAQLGILDALQFLAEVKTSLSQSVTAPIVSQQPTSQSLASEISAAEHDLASLHTVRTMSHDMAAIKPGSDVVYQSSQADILRAPAPIVTPPAPEAPRWDTDTK